jgi:hypothetical protein
VRQVFGIFTSLVTAGLIIIMAQMIREGLFPTPQDLDFTNNLAVSDWMSAMPANFFLTIALSHGLGAFAAGLISSLVMERNRMSTGMISFSVVFIMVMVYLFKYYFPVWFVITDTVVTAVLGFAGAMVGSSRHVS